MTGWLEAARRIRHIYGRRDETAEDAAGGRIIRGIDKSARIELFEGLNRV